VANDVNSITSTMKDEGSTQCFVGL